MKQLAAAIDRLTDWYKADVLPFWAARAADRSGLFYESLDHKGEPETGQPRRVRVQARQVYAFSQAAAAGWLAAGDAIAAKGFQRLVAAACGGDAARGCAHLLDDDGAVIDARRDLYDQAFLILAAAARIKAGDPAAPAIAENALAFLDASLASEDGGYFEDDRGALPRRQNPHMHLFEALMALYGATGEPATLVKARAIEFLFNSRFLDRNRGVLREYFKADWSIDRARGGEIEPGHMVEWVFLLDRFERLTGEDRSREKQMLYRTAKALAAPGDAPFLPNRTTLSDAGARGARRLWPQTEALKASLVLAGDGDDEAAREAAEMIEALFESYFSVETRGLWCDAYDASGRAAAKDVPASILYHLNEAVSCANEFAMKKGL